MKKHMVKILIAGLGLQMLCSVSAQAQTNNTSLGGLIGEFMGSPDTHYIVGGEKGVSSGNKNCYEAYALLAHTVSTNFVDLAVGGGLGEMWSTVKGVPASTFQLSGNISVSQTFTPLGTFGITNWNVATGGQQIIGAPLNGGNQGNLLIQSGVFVEPVDLNFSIKSVPCNISLGGTFANQQGTGGFNGNYAGAYLAFMRGSKDAGMTVMNENRNADSWTALADNSSYGPRW